MELLPPLPLRRTKTDRQPSDECGRNRCCLRSVESVILWFHGCVLFSKIARQSAHEDSSGLCLLLLCKERTKLGMRERNCCFLSIQKAITTVHGCVLPSTKKELYALMDSPLAFASSEERNFQTATLRTREKPLRRPKRYKTTICVYRI